MKKYIFLFTFIALSFEFINSQPVERERMYVQTDKQLYMAGELLWMKLYTTDVEGKLISLSKVGYVELVSDSIPEVQAKIDIQSGAGAGWLELPPMLPTGYYRLIAYTRNMRNEGEKVFFEKKIGIINPYIRNERSFKQDEEEITPGFLSETVLKSRDIVSLSTDKTIYNARNEGKIIIKDLPEEDFSLAVSVAGIDPLFDTGSYLSDWKERLSGKRGNTLSGEKWLPEYEGHIVEGRLINLDTNQPEESKSGVTLLSFPGKNIQLYGGKIDKDGNISFNTNRLAGKHELATVAYDPFGKKYRVDISSPFAGHEPEILPALKIDSAWHDFVEKRSLGVQVTEAYTSEQLSRIEPMPLYFNYKPYKEYLLDEYTRFNYMEELFIEFVMGVRIRRTSEGRIFNMMKESMEGYSIGSTLVLLDNIPVIDHELMVNYNPLLIKKISVYLGRYLFGGNIYDGILSFSSYNNNYPNITFDGSTQIFDYEGTQPYRYFYSPSSTEKTNTRIPDFRHTLLWEPSLWSKKQKELTLPFTTSDVPGKYLVTVEGISKEGTIVSETYEFTVE